MGILASLLRPLFATILISVSRDMNLCSIKVVKKRVGSIVEQDEKEFKILNGELSAEAIKYIKKLKSRYAFSYVGILSRSIDQILVPGSKKTYFSNFGISEKECKIIKLKNQAFISMPKDEVIQYQKEFKSAMGLDFLFSPFVLLFFKSKTFLSDLPKMFVLQDKEYMATFVANRKSVLYGRLFSINVNEGYEVMKYNSDEEYKGGVMSDTINNDDFDNEIGGIDEELADLDNFNFDNISSDGDNVSVSTSDSDDSGMDDLQDLGRSSSILNFLQSALKDFYTNSLYDGDFVEEVVVFDCYGMSSQALDNVKSNLMIDLSIVRINIIEEISNLIQIELDS